MKHSIHEINDNTPLYNIRIIRNHIDYIRKKYPNVNIYSLLEFAGISKFQFNDSGYWCSQNQINKLNEILVKITGNSDISRYTGRHLIDSQNIFAQYILGFQNPSSLALQVGSIYSKLSLGAETHAKKVEKNKVELIIEPKSNVNEQLFQCRNRIGSLEGVYKFFLDEFPQIDHPECFHKGAKYCRYIISWDKPSKIVYWQRIRNHLTVVGFILTFAAFIFLPLTYALLIALIALSTVMYLTEHSFQLEKTKMQKDFSEVSQTAEDYWTELNAGYNVSKLVQEVGEITSVRQNELEISEAIAKAMNKRLDYDRGAIFLTKSEKGPLSFAGGYGFSVNEIEIIQKAHFRIDNTDREGILQKAFNKQSPVLIEDMDKIINDLDPKNREVVNKLNVEAMVCLPIIHEGKSLGVMIVDKEKQKREFKESDINLLEAVASQAALSIAHARAYQKLQESEIKHRTLVETVRDIVYTVDLEGKLTYVSPMAEVVTGYNNQELLGKHFTDIVAPEYKETVLQHFIEGLETGKIFTYEIEISTKAGTPVPVELKVASLTDNTSKSVGRIGVARDITRRKIDEAERQELEVKALAQDKLASLGEIATGIAHEINQPLSYIKVILQATLENVTENKIDTKEMSEEFEESVRQTEKISKIISHLRTFGRSDTKLFGPVKLSKVVGDSLILMKERLRMKNIVFEKNIDVELPFVNGNHAKLEQVLINLIQNSMDAMEKKDQGRISLSAEAENKFITIIYTDTGDGIKPELKERIFEPFFTTKEAGKGTGIGLSIVYGIIQEHQGTISCESLENYGACFKIKLPVYSE